MALLHDGSGLITWDDSMEIQVLDTTTWRLRCAYSRHRGAITSLSVSDDSAVIFSGDHKGQVHIWDASDGRQMGVIESHMRWVEGLSCSADGVHVAFTSMDGEVAVHRVRDLEQVFMRQPDESSIGYPRVWFAANSSRLGILDGSGRLELFDIASGRCLERAECDFAVRSIAASDDRSVILLQSDSNQILVIRTEDLELIDARLGTLWTGGDVDVVTRAHSAGRDSLRPVPTPPDVAIAWDCGGAPLAWCDGCKLVNVGERMFVGYDEKRIFHYVLEGDARHVTSSIGPRLSVAHGTPDPDADWGEIERRTGELGIGMFGIADRLADGSVGARRPTSGTRGGALSRLAGFESSLSMWAALSGAMRRKSK
jgi:hypothetical protein